MIRRFRLLLLVNAALLGATLVYEIIHHRSRLSTSYKSAQSTSTSTTINFALRQAREASEELTENLHIDHTLDLLRQDASLYRASAGSERQHGGNNRGLANANAAIILFCYNREGYLERTLRSLASLRGLEHFTVYISQDGDHPGVSRLIRSTGADLMLEARGFQHWQHPRKPVLGEQQAGHAWLSQHYRWGLSKLFEEEGHTHAIILEDDMLFSPDFLTMFEATAPLLEEDPSLWCVSSWNDNGLAALDWRPERLRRTSYFPGLGWMLRREVWQEIGRDFPDQAWDHWMRLNSTSKGRDCIVPEVSRNKNIGEIGANMNAATFRKFLNGMAWAQMPVGDFGDLSYLRQGAYEAMQAELVSSAQLWQDSFIDAAFEPGKVYLRPYKLEEYEALVKPLGLWPFPRGHQRHLTWLPIRGATVLLADQRSCPLLPDSLRLRAHPGLQPSAAERGVDCNAACKESGMECSQQDFWFLNSCEVLRQHFPCERGCTVELGQDIPNYVLDPDLATHQTCLIAQKQPACGASHPATARLCPCVRAA